MLQLMVVTAGLDSRPLVLQINEFNRMKNDETFKRHSRSLSKDIENLKKDPVSVMHNITLQAALRYV